MVALIPCVSCQFRDHDNHVKNHTPAPEGVMGGAMCDCEGECIDGPDPLESFMQGLRLLNEDRD